MIPLHSLHSEDKRVVVELDHEFIAAIAVFLFA